MNELPTLPMNERFVTAMYASAREWRLLVDQRLRHLRIGQSGWLTIATIAKASGPMSQRSLAEAVGVEDTTIVSMVDRLERGGFVARVASPVDRRVKLVRLTEAGSILYDEVRKVSASVRTGLLGSIDQKQLASVTELLETLVKRTEELL
jgi:MarR family transcriptional regulator for hemolysin